MKNQQLNQEFFMEKGSIVEFILNLSAMDFTYQNNTGFLISKYIKKEKNNYKEIVKKLGCYLDNKNLILQIFKIFVKFCFNYLMSL